MKIIKIIAIAMGLTALSLASVAQEEEAPTVFTYATYFYCGGGPLARVDEIMADDADRMNGLVEDGTITAWGWLAHHTGGQWQRLSYYQAESMDALLDAGDAIQGDGDDDDGDDDDEASDEDEGMSFGQVCPRHDDYIWQGVAGSNSETRGAAGFSVYHVCTGDEDRADELVTEHVGPILDGLVEEGKLNSWGWASHVVGGRFRKLQTMTAPDMKSLMAARGEAIESIYAEGSEVGDEFAEICGAHVDYLWNIQLEGN